MFKLGDWNVICDRCGMDRKASACRMTWDNLFVCSDTCWEPRHPQDFVVGIPDNQSVPIARPEEETPTYETTVFKTANVHDVVIQLDAADGLEADDFIGIEMDNGAMHWTGITADTTDDSVRLKTAMPHKATAGRQVFLQRAVSQTYNYLLSTEGEYLITTEGERIIVL